MNKLIGVLVCVSLCGCADMTPMQRKVAYGVGAVLVVGAIAAHKIDHGDSMPGMSAATSSEKRPFHPSCQAQKGC